MVYRKGRLPDVQTVEELRRSVDEEFGKIEMAQAETTELELRPSFRPPTKPRDGMLVYADGTSWNPGGGVGVYARIGGAWVKL